MPIQGLNHAVLYIRDVATTKRFYTEVMGFETMIDTTLIRGRIDAVYKLDADHYEVVDWKTGKVKSGEDLDNASIQLAMYRLAYAKLKNLPIEKISAAFHYVLDDQTVRPADILDENELIKLVTQIPIQL